MKDNQITNIRISGFIKQSQTKQPQKKTQKLIDYAELQTLRSKKPEKLLPGLQKRKTASFYHKKIGENEQSQIKQKQVPKLLTSAVSLIKRKYEQAQNLQNDKQSLGLSYFSSRQITPINPLGSSFHNNSLLTRKRVKTHQTNKSRLKSINSDMNQMDSHEQSMTHLLPPYKQKDFKLFDVVLGQSETAYYYAFGKQRKIPQKLIYLWKQSLYHQDKTQIFVRTNPEDSVNIPYTHPRIFPLNQLQKGFEEVYGSGKQRCLKVGQEALIIQGIKKYLHKCDLEPMKISRKDYDIISDILVDCKLQELQNFPMCYRQIEAHFKIMATRWKYKNMDNKTNKLFEPAILNGKNNFVDLGKSNVLSEYLLKYSNKNQLI